MGENGEGRHRTSNSRFLPIPLHDQQPIPPLRFPTLHIDFSQNADQEVEQHHIGQEDKEHFYPCAQCSFTELRFIQIDAAQYLRKGIVHAVQYSPGPGLRETDVEYRVLGSVCVGEQ